MLFAVTNTSGSGVLVNRLSAQNRSDIPSRPSVNVRRCCVSTFKERSGFVRVRCVKGGWGLLTFYVVVLEGFILYSVILIFQKWP